MLNVEHTVAKAGNPPDFSIAKDRSDIGHWPHRCGVFDSNALLFRGVGILVHGVGGCFCLISNICLALNDPGSLDPPKVIATLKSQLDTQ